MREAFARYQAGDLAAATAFARSVLAASNRRADAIYLLSAIAGDSGQSQASIDGFALACSIDPTNHVFANAWGDALMNAGKTDEAMVRFETAARLNPAYERAHNNLGRVHHLRGNHAAALASFREAVRLNPQYATAHNNLGGVALAASDPATALHHCQRAIAIRPAYPEAHFNSAGALRLLGNPRQALFHLAEAVRLRPNYPRAHLLMGQVLVDLGQVAASVGSFQNAIKLQPSNAESHRELGHVLMLLGRLTEAIAAFDEALKIEPEDASALVQRLRVKEVLCDWVGRDEQLELVWKHTQRQLDAQDVTSISPIYAASLPCSRQMLRDVGIGHGRAYVKAASLLKKPDPLPAPRPCDRVRIGYLSRDFYDHPVAHQTQGVFAHHDRARFEVHVFSFGPNDKSAFRKKIERDAEFFHDVEAASHSELYREIKSQNIDILVDLMGYTGLARTAVVATRPAPIQVNWLGFAGTMGADFIDYLIGDPVLTPPEHADGYTERLVRLPHSYMPADNQQPVGDPALPPPRRADEGLPDDAFVFCCFNNPYKIDPSMFDVWMRILRQVPGSVAWLSVRDPVAQGNLAREAGARGVARERLIFSQHAPSKAQHLARHRLADLFLDTRYYNAHATAADALWAGLPLLSCPGDAFAARVGASQLTAAGLPELIASDLADYEQTAVRLALHPGELASLREKLAASRAAAPMFDTARFVRNLERAYELMWARHRAGLPPEAIDVTE